MRLIDALSKGVVREFGVPDREIETVLSRLFFFGDQVVKVYKHKKHFFADLEEINPRRKFIEDDFFWNNLSAPEIYKDLVGVKNDGFKPVPADQAEDFYILMTKIDGEASLTKLLQEKKLNREDISHLTVKLVELFRELTHKKIKDYKYLVDKGRRQTWQESVIESLPPWMAMAGDHIPHGEIENVVNFLATVTEKEKYFIDYDPAYFAVVIDNNCDNLLFLDGKPSFIDIMPPKEGWRVADEFEVISRTAVDVSVIGGDELGQIVRDVYKKYRPTTTQSAQYLYELRAALIQWAYRHMISQHDLAHRYRQFAMSQIEKLKDFHQIR